MSEVIIEFISEVQDYIDNIAQSYDISTNSVDEIKAEFEEMVKDILGVSIK